MTDREMIVRLTDAVIFLLESMAARPELVRAFKDAYPCKGEGCPSCTLVLEVNTARAHLARPDPRDAVVAAARKLAKEQDGLVRLRGPIKNPTLELPPGLEDLEAALRRLDESEEKK